VGVPPKELSAAHHVSPGYPPCIIFHGTADDTLTFATVERFTELMKQAGNGCALHPFEGGDHGFLILVGGKMKTRIIIKH